jgi:hypothetical protein
MYKLKTSIILAIGILAALSCNKTETKPSSNNPDTVLPGSLGAGQPGVVGSAGIASWDALASSEKNKIKSWNSLFVHASVGTDLEDGAEANGYKFEYYDAKTLNQGLNGTDWKSIGDISNSEGLKKIAGFKAEALKQKDKLHIAIFKFGYADINDTNLEAMKTAYKAMIDELRAAKLRFVHITPPLITITSQDDGNAAKTKMGSWMKDTFRSQDVVFDLQEIESNNGSCNLAGVWTLCPQYRSTASCSSKSQGIDSPEGQGHLCEKEATRISKAFLMSIYNVGK